MEQHLKKDFGNITVERSDMVDAWWSQPSSSHRSRQHNTKTAKRRNAKNNSNNNSNTTPHHTHTSPPGWKSTWPVLHIEGAQLVERRSAGSCTQEGPPTDGSHEQQGRALPGHHGQGVLTMVTAEGVRIL